MILGQVISRESIQNGIYESVRKRLVQLGRLPDIITYPTQNAFNTALAALRTTLANSGLEIISVDGVMTTEGRDGMEMNRFYINYKGSTGNGANAPKMSLEESTPEETIPANKRFRRVRVPMPRNLLFEVRWKTKSTENDEFMETALSTALGECSYVMGYNNEGTEQGEFLIQFNGVIDMSTGRSFDKIARFIVKDVITYEPQVIKDNIMPATITTEIEQVNEFPPDEE